MLNEVDKFCFARSAKYLSLVESLNFFFLFCCRKFCSNLLAIGFGKKLFPVITETNKQNFREPRNANEPQAGRLKLSERHFDGPILQDFNGSQFKIAEYGGMWKLKFFEPDNCVILTDSRVIQVRNIVQSDNINYIIGQKLRTEKDYCQHPVPSSFLHQYIVSNLSPILSAWNVEHIMHKCVKLPASFEHIDSCSVPNVDTIDFQC